MVFSFNASWFSIVNSKLLFLIFLDNFNQFSVPTAVQSALEKSLMTKAVLIAENISTDGIRNTRKLSPNLALYSNQRLQPFLGY